MKGRVPGENDSSEELALSGGNKSPAQPAPLIPGRLLVVGWGGEGVSRLNECIPVQGWCQTPKSAATSAAGQLCDLRQVTPHF